MEKEKFELLKQNANFIQVVPDSQYYDMLEQILESIRLLNKYYILELIQSDKTDYWILLEKPPISIKEIIKGIENTIEKGYKLTKK